MTTTGTSAFNLDVNDLIEEAFERCGRELRTGYDFRTARRSLNLLTIEWANRGINLWTIEQGQIPLYPNQSVYPLPVDTIDLLDQVTRTGTGLNQNDINVNRISESTYSTIPNKNAQGRPIQVWINRQSGESNPTAATIGGSQTLSSDATTIPVNNISELGSAGFIQVGSELIAYSAINGGNLVYCARGQNGTTAASHAVGSAITVVNLPAIYIWPTPNQGSAGSPYYTFVYWRMRRIQDTGTGVKTQDIPFRFLECMVAGLAYKMALKLPDMDANRLMALKSEYEQQFQLAADEDRDKSNDRFVPRVLFYS